MQGALKTDRSELPALLNLKLSLCMLQRKHEMAHAMKRSLIQTDIYYVV